MSRTLDGMEREGLVRRKNRPGDMRVRELHLTEKGRKAFQRDLAGHARLVEGDVRRDLGRGIRDADRAVDAGAGEHPPARLLSGVQHAAFLRSR